MCPATSNRRWLLVARGLRLKYLAMWILLATPLVALLAHSLEINIWWTICSNLAIALIVDSVGRVLCLMGNIVKSKSLLASTAVQLSVILVAIGFSGEVPRNPSMGVVLFWLLVFGQFLSAITFTIYLRALAEHVLGQELTTASDRVMTSLASVPVITAALATLIPIVFVLILLGSVLFYPFGYPVMLFVGSLVVVPLAIALLVIAIRMLANYGILLVQLRSALQAGAKPEV